MLWGGREILLAQTKECCLLNTKIPKFCCSSPANFSQTFRIYLPCHGNIWAPMACWEKSAYPMEYIYFAVLQKGPHTHLTEAETFQ